MENALGGLERTTQALSTVSTREFSDVFAAMNDRSRAVARFGKLLAESRSPPAAAVLNRLKACRDDGNRMRAKLLAMRMAIGTELQRLGSTAFLARALTGSGHGSARRVDFHG